jgi:dienelactone hydrolase
LFLGIIGLAPLRLLCLRWWFGLGLDCGKCGSDFFGDSDFILFRYMSVIKTMIAATPVGLVAGAAGSVGLTLYAGRHNSSPALPVIFVFWVLSPFVALAVADLVSTRWSASTRTTLRAMTVVLALGSLAVYAYVTLGPWKSRPTPAFVVVPPASLLIAAVVVSLAAMISGTLSPKRLIKTVVLIALGGICGIALLVGLLLGLLWLDHNRETELPTPSGPFAVGRAMYVWSDAAHSDPTAPQAGSKRELVAWVWYPAAPSQSSQSVEDYFPGPWRSAVEQYSVLFTKFLTRDLSRVHTHSIREAELSSQEQSYPVVLMRAGAAAQTLDYTCLAEDLASHGYVVVGIDVPYRSGVVVFPDGRVIRRAPQNNGEDLSGSEQEKLANKLVAAWSADMSFTLDELNRLNNSDPSGRFIGRLDMQRVGAFGHSLGGAGALQFCHDDSRCKAGVNVDGAPWGSVVCQGVTQPIMLLFSDHGDESDPDKGWILSNIQSVCRHSKGGCVRITVHGCRHFNFSDHALLKNYYFSRLLDALGPIDNRRGLAITSDCLRTFFDIHLKNAAAGNFSGALSSRYPEIQVEAPSP